VNPTAAVRTTKCDLKGDFLPKMIYGKPDAVQGGNEEFISNNGAYIN
jgi:hypothetical protein